MKKKIDLNSGKGNDGGINLDGELLQRRKNVVNNIYDNRKNLFIIYY